MPEFSVEMIKYADVALWKPKIGDVIVEEGLFFRSWSVVESISTDGLKCRNAGLLRLICVNRFKYVTYQIEKIRSSTSGSFAVVQDGVFYV